MFVVAECSFKIFDDVDVFVNWALQSRFTGCASLGQLICFFITPQFDVCSYSSDLLSVSGSECIEGVVTVSSGSTPR